MQPSGKTPQERQSDQLGEGAVVPRQKLTTIVVAIVAGGLGMVAMAAVLDDFGPPPPGDPSEFTGPLIGEPGGHRRPGSTWTDCQRGRLRRWRHWDGGGRRREQLGAGESSRIPAAAASTVPTGGPPSPLFGAGEFSQQMLRFEEFGTRAPGRRTGPHGGLSFAHHRSRSPSRTPPTIADSVPAPTDPRSPSSTRDGISPASPPSSGQRPPTSNPVGSRRSSPSSAGPSIRSSRRGPPAGQGLGAPAVERVQSRRSSYNTLQGGARTNGGARDRPPAAYGYTAGEFGPGGLYHRGLRVLDVHGERQ